MNWNASVLCKLARLSGEAYKAQAALHAGTNGLFPIFLEDALSEIVEPTFGLNADDVAQIEAGLRNLNTTAMLAAIPSDEVVWNMLIGSDMERSSRYSILKESLDDLLGFYAAAASAGQAVIVWWD